jgi:hypothetical protein
MKEYRLQKKIDPDLFLLLPAEESAALILISVIFILEALYLRLQIRHDGEEKNRPARTHRWWYFKLC